MITQLFYEAYINLVASGHRAILAIIGITIGTASVIAMVNIGEMVEYKSLKKMNELGPDLLSISLLRQLRSGNASNEGLDNDKIKSISDNINGHRGLVPIINIANTVEWHGCLHPHQIVGTTRAMMEIAKLELYNGRFISKLDGYEPFVVVGSAVFSKTSSDCLRSPIKIDDTIQIGSSLFTVIGILQPKPENYMLSVNTNESLFISVDAAKRISSNPSIYKVVTRVNNIEQLNIIGDMVASAIRKILPSFTVQVMTPNQIIEAIHQQSHSFTILLGAIGGISLIVGGIGIMNIMMVSVVERRREIGLRLAIGARRRDIAWLFLMEAIILSMAGGVAGFGLGMVVSFIFGRISDIEFIVSGISIPLGLFVSLVVGIFFGYYPASRAARLDPVQALHNE